MKFSFRLEICNHVFFEGRYRRLDRFQDDLFDLFTAAMENSHSDSQVYVFGKFELISGGCFREHAVFRKKMD